jgi:RNA polymerase sigma-70 factor (ECF subfamily)
MPETDPGGAIAALFDAGQAAFPAVRVDEAVFAGYLGERRSPGDTALPPPSLASDLYLACACVLGAKGAHAAFMRCFSPVIMGAAASVGRSSAFAEDVHQSVLEALFCAPRSGTPKIARYAGRAPLPAFLCTVATRVAIDQLRPKGSAPGALDAQRENVAPFDVERAYVEARYKPDFEAAPRAAMRRLDPRQRALLRMNLRDGMSIDVLAVRYDVARATAARWLRKALGALRDGTRAEVVGKHGLTDSQYTSLAELIRSRLDVSLTSLFRD